MLKNVGKDGFQILGHTGVAPVICPDLPGMALAWAGQNSFCPGARAAWRAKKFPFDQESIWVELACQKM